MNKYQKSILKELTTQNPRQFRTRVLCITLLVLLLISYSLYYNGFYSEDVKPYFDFFTGFYLGYMIYSLVIVFTILAFFTVATKALIDIHNLQNTSIEEQSHLKIIKQDCLKTLKGSGFSDFALLNLLKNVIENSFGVINILIGNQILGLLLIGVSLVRFLVFCKIYHCLKLTISFYPDPLGEETDVNMDELMDKLTNG